MGKFIANPDMLAAKGNGIIEQAMLFRRNVEKIYNTVHELTNSDYLSPEAVAIGNQIQTYKTDLETMAKIIEEYGVFCKNSGNSVIKNQQIITEGIK